MCDHKLWVVMWDSKLRCACANPFWLKLAMCVRAVHFYACEVWSQLCTFFSNNARYENLNALSFAVNYISVAQKLRIKAIFDPKNPFLNNSIDDRIKIKAEITSFNMTYYMNLIKLRLCLQVATIKNASCAHLRVRRDFWLRRCGCSNTK